jgi:hypothetical protein
MSKLSNEDIVAVVHTIFHNPPEIVAARSLMGLGHTSADLGGTDEEWPGFPTHIRALVSTVMESLEKKAAAEATVVTEEG